ncbi:MAG TPA: phosphoenolpyruvate--protein phosphotransferase [Oleiagrimonas sp.]|nr:phosphoenolpyruvate--protein phosphotransferase [Oleiagrimonas sp.]
MRQVLEGNVGARGMALGRARRVQTTKIRIDPTPLADHEIDDEIERLHQALETARDELLALRDKMHGSMAREAAEFVDAHNMLLSDPDLLRGLDTMVRDERMRAGAALKAQRDRLAAVFEAMDDPYLRSRSEDIDQVIGRVLGILARDSSHEERKLASRVGEILVAESIAPGDMASLAGRGLLGVVTVTGSAYSHSAILARNLSLPMLIGVGTAMSAIGDNDLVLLDGEAGQIIVHPASQDLARYRRWQRDTAREGKRLAALANAPTRTLDGVDIRLFANAEQPGDLATARAHGASGIGLYRSEFLFLQSKGLPSEDEQFSAYRNLVLAMGGLPVTIRTLDLGADKAGTAGLSVPDEDNPALGVRGVRLSLRHPVVFATQLRAILRAASYGPVRILVPMITQADELDAVRTLIEHCTRDLHNEGEEPPDNIPVGAMIEVPSAALTVRTLLKHADFLALGTNDLAQYLLATDRNNDALGKLYNPLQPALLRLIHHVINAGKRAGKPVSLCGEMGGDPLFTPLLLALGLTDFSMHPGQLLTIRDHIADLDRTRLRRLGPRILRAASREEVEAIVRNAIPATP